MKKEEYGHLNIEEYSEGLFDLINKLLGINKIIVKEVK